MLGNDFVVVFYLCFVFSCFFLFKCRGIICFIFKKGDRFDSRNWRLVTFLNVDYKFVSRFIAGYLLKVIYLVVDKD